MLQLLALYILKAAKGDVHIWKRCIQAQCPPASSWVWMALQ